MNAHVQIKPRLLIVEGAGHFVFEDAPERTASEVADFLGTA